MDATRHVALHNDVRPFCRSDIILPTIQKRRRCVFWPRYCHLHRRLDAVLPCSAAYCSECLVSINGCVFICHEGIVWTTFPGKGRQHASIRMNGNLNGHLKGEVQFFASRLWWTSALLAVNTCVHGSAIRC